MNLCSDAHRLVLVCMPSWICPAPCTSVLRAGRRLLHSRDNFQQGAPSLDPALSGVLICLTSIKLHRKSLAFAGSAAFAHALLLTALQHC